MLENDVKKLFDQLELDNNSQKEEIRTFLKTISCSKLAPYIEYITTNKEKHLKISKHKDLWESLIVLYHFNIKLSTAIYPYIFIIETALKTQINLLMCLNLGDEWYQTEELYFKAFNVDNLDKQVINAFWQYKELYTPQIDKIDEFYRKSIPGISNNQLRKRINKVKSCIYILSNIREYINKSCSPNLTDFVENNTTFGYWSALINNKYFWSSPDINLEQLFIKPETDKFLINRKKVIKMIESIRILRNYISHYKRIIGCNIYEGTGYAYTLLEIYYNIKSIFNLITDQDIDEIVEDIQFKSNSKSDNKENSFENLYKEFKSVYY